VLDSIGNLTHVLDGKVTSIEWIAPSIGRGKNRRPGVSAIVDRSLKTKLGKKMKAASTNSVTKDGVLEMADFKPDEFKRRLRPAIGPSMLCTFAASQANEVQAALRHPVRIEGHATIDPQTGKTEQLRISRIEALDSLELDAGSFFAHPTFDQLARQQGAKPLVRSAALAGVLPPDFDVDEMVANIYRDRA